MNIKFIIIKNFDHHMCSIILVVFGLAFAMAFAQPSSSLRKIDLNSSLTHHSLRVTVDPFLQTIEVEDLIKFP